MADDQRLQFTAGIDTNDIQRDAQKIRSEIHGIDTQAKRSGESMDSTFKKIGAAVAGAFAVEKIASFLVQVANIRGEFQKLDIAFTTMLGSKERSDALIKQLVNTAATTPFTLNDVTGGAKQLLAFGIEAEKVNNTLIRLGDIAAGTGANIGQLTNVFGQIKAAGRMNGGDLLQFINAGVPIIKALADTMGVAESKVKDLIGKGKVGFKEVEAAINSLTDAGSTFGGMMEAQSKTITGQWSSLQDNITQIYNTIGKQMEGTFNTSLSIANTLVENYDTLGRALLALIGTYGAYRTAIVAVRAGVTSMTLAENAHYLALVASEKAQKLLNATMLKNPYVLAATAIIAVAGGMYTYFKHTEKANAEQKKLNETMHQAEAAASTEISKLASLRGQLAAAQKGTSEYKRVKDQIVEQFGKYNDGLKEELETVGLTAQTYDLLAKNIRKAAMARGMEQAIEEKTADLQKALTKTMTSVKDEIDDWFKGREDVGAEIYTKIRDGIANGTAQLKDTYINGNATKIITGFDEQVMAVLNANNGNNKVQKKLQEYLRKQLNYDEAIEEIQKTFKVTDEVTTTSLDEVVVSGANGKKELTDKEIAAAKREAERRAKAKEDIANMLVDIQNSTDAMEANAIEEGVEKKIEKIWAAYDKQADAIKKQAKKLADLNKTAGTKDVDKDTGLTSDQQKTIDDANDANAKNREQQLKDVYDTLLEKYQDYTTQRLAIEEKFNKDIADLEKLRAEATEAGDDKQVEAISRSINKAIADKGKALMAHDFEVLKQDPQYIRAFEDLNNTSEQTLKALLERFEQAKISAAEVLNPEDLKQYTDIIEQIAAELAERDPFGNLARSREQLRDADTNLANAEQKLAQAKERVLKATLKATGLDGKVDTNNKELNKALTEQEEAEGNLSKAKDDRVKAQNKVNKAENAALSSTDKLIASLKDVGNAVGGEAGEIINFIGDVASFAKMAMQGVQTSAEGTSKAIQAVEKASFILTIISMAIQLIQKLNSLLPKSEYEKAVDKQKEMSKLTKTVNDYRMAIANARKEEAAWFGSRGVADLNDSWLHAADTLQSYQKVLYETQVKYQNESGNGWLTKAASWLNDKIAPIRWINEIGNKIDETLNPLHGITTATTDRATHGVKYVQAINNLRIETRKASKGFLGTGLGGKSQKTEDLQSWINANKEKFKGIEDLALFDTQGMINSKLAQAIIDNFGDKLVGETKDTMEALIELKQEYDEYQKELKEYVSQLYEPLVDNFVDSIWEWFDSGKDALASFKKSATDTFRDIVSDMLRTIILAKIFENYQDQIKDIYDTYAKGGDEQKMMEDVAKATGDLLMRAEQNLPTIENVIAAVDDKFREYGISLKQSQSQEGGTSASLGKLTQDQGEEIAGRLTAMYMTVQQINEQAKVATEQRANLLGGVQDIRTLVADALDIQQQSLDHLATIERYTASIPTIATDVAKIRKEMLNQ